MTADAKRVAEIREREEHWALDCSMESGIDGIYCFVPIELRDDGEIDSIVYGMNVIADLPGGCKKLAIVHPDGQQAVESWMDTHKEQLEALTKLLHAQNDNQ